MAEPRIGPREELRFPGWVAARLALPSARLQAKEHASITPATVPPFPLVLLVHKQARQPSKAYVAILASDKLLKSS